MPWVAVLVHRLAGKTEVLSWLEIHYQLCNQAPSVLSLHNPAESCQPRHSCSRLAHALPHRYGLIEELLQQSLLAQPVAAWTS